MGCSASKPAEEEVKRPHVKKSATSTVPDEQHLPLGVQLTGGARLRSLGLLGQGVKVAVVDSGIDKDHKAFDGKVVEQKWYRSGEPLSESDHGTHVAVRVRLHPASSRSFEHHSPSTIRRRNACLQVVAFFSRGRFISWRQKRKSMIIESLDRPVN